MATFEKNKNIYIGPFELKSLLLLTIFQPKLTVNQEYIGRLILFGENLANGAFNKIEMSFKFAIISQPIIYKPFDLAIDISSEF